MLIVNHCLDKPQWEDTEEMDGNKGNPVVEGGYGLNKLFKILTSQRYTVDGDNREQ